MRNMKEKKKQGRGRRKREKDQDGVELPFSARLTRSLRPCGFEMVSHKAVAAFNVELCSRQEQGDQPRGKRGMSV